MITSVGCAMPTYGRSITAVRNAFGWAVHYSGTQYSPISSCLEVMEESFIPVLETERAVVREHSYEVDIDKLLFRNKQLKRHITITFEQEEDYFLCYNQESNIYGVGDSYLEARNAFEHELLEKNSYLKRNRNKLGPINQPEVDFIKSII